MFGIIKKLNNKTAATITEMLCVVAIITILSSTVIPTYTRNLEQSREVKDMHNLNAAKAAIMAEYFYEPDLWSEYPFIPDGDSKHLIRYYNHKTGEFQDTPSDDCLGYGSEIEGYEFKSATSRTSNNSNNEFGYGSNIDYREKYLVANIVMMGLESGDVTGHYGGYEVFIVFMAKNGVTDFGAKGTRIY